MAEETTTPGTWSAESMVYSDALDAITIDKIRSATIIASYTGTMQKAVATAPALGSYSELLPDDMRCNKRTFTRNGQTVTVTLGYCAFKDDTATYKMKVMPKSVSLLAHRRFKNISDEERMLAQEYLSGGTDATVVYHNTDAEKLEFADSEPKDSPDIWEETTLRKLVEKYTPNSTAVRFARKGIKTLPGEKIEWEETKITGTLPSTSGIGEEDSPRGDYPGGHKWTLKSIEATSIAPDEWGNKRYNVVTMWVADEYPEEKGK
ncbi:MAG: hypothetical protein E7037_08170 [Verrucomicrobia bacterium]|nr:hypothetical protein [Verrucomicrobiota bacterium]